MRSAIRFPEQTEGVQARAQVHHVVFERQIAGPIAVAGIPDQFETMEQAVPANLVPVAA